MRIPQAALAWLLVGTVSSPIPDLTGELEAAGLVVLEEKEWLFGSLALAVAERSA